MTETASEFPAAKLALYADLVATLRGVERKGSPMPHTSQNGHIFSYMSKSGALALRLPADVRADFLKTYKTTLCRAYGIVQTEYVDVPDALLEQTAELAPYLAESLAYVRAMKPKPKVKPPKVTTTKVPTPKAKSTKAKSTKAKHAK